MNTISPIRPYMGLKNEPLEPQSAQSTQTAPETAVSFKGTIGDTLLKEAAANKTVPTVETIFSKIKSTFGVSADKTKDVLESFVGKIKSLTSENANLREQLSTTVNSMEQNEQNAKNELANMEQWWRDSFAKTLEQKNTEIAEKDAKIADLQKYEGMAKVKSVEELDEILPEQFLEILKEAKESEKKAQDSLLEYVFTGKGQEEFLAQIERSNKILKAKMAGIEEMPEMAAAYKDSHLKLGFDPIYVAKYMLKEALINSEKGLQIMYPPVSKLVEENFNAITAPMRNKNTTYAPTSKCLDDIKTFYNGITANSKELAKKGYKLIEQSELNGRQYYSFINSKDGSKLDIFKDDLSAGWFGMARIIDAQGNIKTLNKDWK